MEEIAPQSVSSICLDKVLGCVVVLRLFYVFRAVLHDCRFVARNSSDMQTWLGGFACRGAAPKASRLITRAKLYPNNAPPATT